MSIWAALGFMSLGAIIVEIYNYRAWRMYREGKSEGKAERDCTNVGRARYNR